MIHDHHSLLMLLERGVLTRDSRTLARATCSVSQTFVDQEPPSWPPIMYDIYLIHVHGLIMGLLEHSQVDLTEPSRI